MVSRKLGFFSCLISLLAAITLLAQDPQASGDFKAKLKATLKAVAEAAAAGNPAQSTPKDPSKIAHLEGRVVDGAGQPVRTAQVQLARPAGNGQVPGLPEDTTTSNEEGKFVFDIEASPNLALTAQKAGYSVARYGAKTPTAPVVLFGIKPGESMTDLVLTMIQQGVLSGRVVDDAGDPLQGVQVILMRRAYQQGIRQLTPSNSVPTNDLGEFRLAGLNAGRYYLIARDTRVRADGLIPLPTYYPSATDERGAAPLEVVDGQDKGNLEIRMRTGKGYTVNGTVEGYVPTPSPAVAGGNAVLSAAAVTAVPEAVANGTMSVAGFQTPGSTVRPDGAFELRQVLPGAYELRLQRLDANGQRTTATARVIVGTSDVKGVILKPAPSYTITGKVSVEGATLAEMFGTVVNTQANNGTNALTVGATGMRLVFFPAAGNTLGSQMTAAVGSDGTFKLEGVPPGRYTLNQGTVAATSIKAVRWDDTDVTDKGLVINSNGTMEVVYRRGAVRATGTVKTAAGDLRGGAQIVIWPAEPLPVFIANGIRSTTSDRNGAWNIGAVRPGSHYVAAFEDLDNNTAQIRDFLDMFAGVAQKLDVKEGAPLTLTLDPIPGNKVREAFDKLP